MKIKNYVQSDESQALQKARSRITSRQRNYVMTRLKQLNPDLLKEILAERDFWAEDRAAAAARES